MSDMTLLPTGGGFGGDAGAAGLGGAVGGLMSIVEMEYKELMTEKADGSHHGIEKELTDLAAACICALRKMKSM